MEEICKRSGGVSDNGTLGGRGTVRKCIDGRTVEEDTAECGTHPAVLWTFPMTEASEKGIRRGSPIGVKGCSRGVRGWGREEAVPLELGRRRREMSDAGRVRDSENEGPKAGSLGSKVQTLRRRDGLSCKTELSATLVLVWRGRRRGSSVHSASFPVFTHVVQGRLPSHF